jgi:hypothetical protein
MVLKNKWFKLVNNSTYPLQENVSCSATLLPRIGRALPDEFLSGVALYSTDI